MSTNTTDGILEIMDGGHGFLRNPQKNFQPQKTDVFVPGKIIKDFNLKDGHHVLGKLGKAPNPNQSKPLKEIVKINGLTIPKYEKLKEYKTSVVIDPEEPLKMQMSENDITGRMIDLFTPIGKGQRGMVISPPKAGKTSILKHVAKAVLQNHADVDVFALLIDERPEEVTDFQRDLPGATVFHSSSDQDVEKHLHITSLAMNTAIRIAESGGDVLVIIDSLTRMGRAFNKDADSGGKTLTGGLAANAMEFPRRFFGAARNIENGGSLTIVATILVETGSRIGNFVELKGVPANVNLLNRHRIFAAEPLVKAVETPAQFFR